MKKLFLLLLSLSFLISYAQTANDSLVIKTKKALLQYSITKDLQSLYSVGFELPWGIEYGKQKMTENDLAESRKIRTKLYIKWLLKMIDEDLDINFNPESPENRCFRNNLITVTSDPVEKEKLEKLNDENNAKIEKLYQFEIYSRVMDRFRCYYKVAFMRYGLDEKSVIKLIKEVEMETVKSEKIIALIKKELKKNTCNLF